MAPPEDAEEMTLQRATSLVGGGNMDVPEVEAFMRLSRAQVYVLMARRELPFIKEGRRRLIPKQAVIEYMAKKLVATSAQT